MSNQRETQLRELELNALPESVSVGEQGQTLQIQWPAACEVSGGAHASTFASQWLRKYRYDSSSGYAAATARAWSNDEVEMWHPQELKEVPTVSWDALGGNSSDGGRAADEAALRCLRMLRRYGFVRVRGTPSTMEATQQLAEQLGALQPSFYGTLWDTAPREAGNVIDTAYSNVELPLHTDGSYQEHQPGLQLFNCVAQVKIGAPWGGRWLAGRWQHGIGGWASACAAPAPRHPHPCIPSVPSHPPTDVQPFPAHVFVRACVGACTSHCISRPPATASRAGGGGR